MSKLEKLDVNDFLWTLTDDVIYSMENNQIWQPGKKIYLVRITDVYLYDGVKTFNVELNGKIVRRFLCDVFENEEQAHKTINSFLNFMIEQINKLKF